MKRSPQFKELGEINILVVLVIFFALGAVIFGVLWVKAFGETKSALASLSSAKTSGYEQGQEEQKSIDEKKYYTQISTPFRSYIASKIYGGFEIKFPKHWSTYVEESESATDQVKITLHPDAVRVVSGKEAAYAIRITLTQKLTEAVQRDFAEKVKSKKLTQKEVKVSGISATQYTGKIDSKHDGITTLIPIRDKTLIITTEDLQFTNEYNQILAQAVIKP